jgi:protein-tyrosine phosphatase
LFQQALQDREQGNVEVRSAGLFAFPGNSPDEEMVRFLLERGGTPGNHRARLLGSEDVVWADLILAMEHRHTLSISQRFPEAQDKTHLLGRFIPGVDRPEEIPDPFGLSSAHYRHVQTRIVLAVEGLLKEVLQGDLKG